MERAEALRALIERVEVGGVRSPRLIKLGVAPSAVRPFYGTLNGSLDAVARLEAPLRERGWVGPFVSPPKHEAGWGADWYPSPKGGPYIKGEPEIGYPTEPRARLLAVLRALLHEAEAEGRTAA